MSFHRGTIVFLPITLLLLFQPVLAFAEILGTWPVEGSKSATITLNAIGLPGSKTTELERVSTGRVMRLIVKFNDSATDWVAGIDRVSINASMPQHGHGMLTRLGPSKKISKGTFAIDGVQFHMLGEWMITVTAHHGSTHGYNASDDITKIQIHVRDAK